MKNNNAINEIKKKNHNNIPNLIELILNILKLQLEKNVV